MAAPTAYAFITEQPAPKGLRFRYECEGRSAGSILARSSSGENKTFPTIKVAGYNGCFIVVVSCVTKDEPYKPHPHNLVGRDCAMGVCTVKDKTEPEQDGKLVTFKNLGIQCVKRRDIPEALRVRQEMRVNPFKTGYSHRSQPQSIDLNAVRLCFQVFLADDSYRVLKALPPFVSDVIYDKKAMSDLHIARASHCTGTARGGTTIILLCEKVTREDTEVWFYREENGGIVWQDRGHIEFVHKQLAIVLKTPPYADPRTQEHVTVLLQLHRISDDAKSNAFNFEYFPEAQDKDDILSRKRPKKLSPHLRDYEERSSLDMAIKAEPRDRTPPHPMGGAGYGNQWRLEAGAAAQAYAGWGSPAYSAHAHSPEPRHVQVMSPPQAAGAGSPLLPASPYMLSPHMHQQSPQGMHMQNLSVHSPISSVSPALSPGLMPSHMSPGPTMVSMQPGTSMQPCASMAGMNMQPGVSMAGHSMAGPNMVGPSMVGPSMAGPSMQQNMLGGLPTMDPVMGDVGQQPIYAQMDTSASSTPSLATLLAQHGAEEAAFTSGDLSSFLLGDRGDLSELSLNRLSTKDLLDPHE